MQNLHNMKWEYVVQRETFDDDSLLMKYLDNKGFEGWQLVQVIDMGSNPDRYIFKRQIPPTWHIHEE